MVIDGAHEVISAIDITGRSEPAVMTDWSPPRHNRSSGSDRLADARYGGVGNSICSPFSLVVPPDSCNSFGLASEAALQGHLLFAKRCPALHERGAGSRIRLGLSSALWYATPHAKRQAAYN